MTTIKLWNSAARGKVDLIPLDPANVRMYVCGPTVYDRAHIGNARPAVVFDVLFRLLRHVYGPDHVTYVRNITDIDDKIMDRARERGVGIDQITAETTRWYQEDMEALGCLPPTHQPRATEFVPQMVAMIETLVAKGHAYEAQGHVLFEVAKDPEYGALSGRSTDDMIAGARVEVAPFKRDPMDFVLWKPSAPDQPGWESPWGRGRPGWHIECSAMAGELLGATFDIHGGGADLMFPHHENEIAQSRCACPEGGFARVWMHNGMINVDGRKMSKSLGNFTTVHDVNDSYKRDFHIPDMGLAMRMRFLMTHYRDVLDWTDSSLEEAATKLGSYYHFLRDFERPTDNEMRELLSGSAFEAALFDDLNIHRAIVEIDKRSLKYGALASANPDSQNKMRAEAIAYLWFLGFEIDRLRTFNLNERQSDVAESLSENIRTQVSVLLRRRAEAREARDFAAADAIRKGLDEAGIVVIDQKGGPSEWRPGPDFDPAKLEALR